MPNNPPIVSVARAAADALKESTQARRVAGQALDVVTAAEQRFTERDAAARVAVDEAVRRADDAARLASGAMQRVLTPGPQGEPGPQGPQGEQGKDGKPGKDGTRFVWRGEFVPYGAYSENDVVRWKGGKGGVWVFITPGRGATPATAGAELMVPAGEDGKPGAGGPLLSKTTIATGSSAPTQVFVQPTEPVVAAGVAFLWVRTGLGDGSDFTMNFGVGL